MVGNEGRQFLKRVQREVVKLGFELNEFGL